MSAQGPGDRCAFNRERRNGLKHATMREPGAMSRGSYAQLRGHCSRSGQ